MTTEIFHQQTSNFSPQRQRDEPYGISMFPTVSFPGSMQHRSGTAYVPKHTLEQLQGQLFAVLKE